MTLPTTTDHYAAIRDLFPLLPILTGQPHDALLDALTRTSPVDTVSDAVEALYAAVKSGALTGDALAEVVTACNQVAYLLTYRQWAGKADRGADISTAMEAIAAGTPVATACASVDVDPQFAPVPVPVIAPAS